VKGASEEKDVIDERSGQVNS